MSGWRPLINGYFGVALVVGAVMSSAFGAELSPPALMLSADPLPPSRERLTAQTKPRASGSIRFPAHHLSVTLDSSAAVLLASLDCEL
jgi:hypothetical protein